MIFKNNKQNQIWFSKLIFSSLRGAQRYHEGTIMNRYYDSRNRLLISSEGNMQLSLLPKNLYLLFAMRS